MMIAGWCGLEGWTSFTMAVSLQLPWLINNHGNCLVGWLAAADPEPLCETLHKMKRVAVLVMIIFVFLDAYAMFCLHLLSELS
jgi:hypothetical protein